MTQKEWKTFFHRFLATHNPTWAGVQNLFTLLLISEACRMVLDRAGEEAGELHSETSGGPIQDAASTAEPTVHPNWDVMLGIGSNLEIIETAFLQDCEEGAETKKP